jgi:heterodisulfide reductase subunit C2
MNQKPTFSKEVANLLHASEGNPIQVCIQCGTCAGTCPVGRFMDLTPRELIANIAADRKELVLNSNSFWNCASCYHCTVRCPQGINIAEMMYALRRYSLWRRKYRKGLIGPRFSEQFVKLIVKYGRSYEPGLAPVYITRYGARGLLGEAFMGMLLFGKGRLPLRPSRLKRMRNFRRVLARIMPMGGAA